MTRRTIEFTIELPERTTDVCPKGCGDNEYHSESDDSDDDPRPCMDDWHLAEKTHQLPAVWGICNRCKGEGSHVNPSIDGHGISAEEWENEWDEESREMYMTGGYDVRCEAGCEGGRVLVVDEAACENEPLKSLLKTYRKQQADRARSDAEDRRTRWYESGGTDGSYW